MNPLTSHRIAILTALVFVLTGVPAYATTITFSEATLVTRGFNGQTNAIRSPCSWLVVPRPRRLERDGVQERSAATVITIEAGANCLSVAKWT